MNTHKVDIVNVKSTKIADSIFESIHATMHAFRSEQYKVLRDSTYELTHMEGKLLGYFARHPGSKLSDVAQRTGRDKGQLAKIIKTLKAQNLLEATADSQDRRSVCLQLSEAGKTVHQNLQQQLSAVAEKAVSNLSKNDQNQLYELLEKVRLAVMEKPTDSE